MHKSGTTDNAKMAAVGCLDGIILHISILSKRFIKCKGPLNMHLMDVFDHMFARSRP